SYRTTSGDPNSWKIAACMDRLAGHRGATYVRLAAEIAPHNQPLGHLSRRMAGTAIPRVRHSTCRYANEERLSLREAKGRLARVPFKGTEDRLNPIAPSGVDDTTLGGYPAVHGRAPGFEGADGSAYTVAIE